MKPNRRLQHWLSSALFGVALTAAPGVGLAANIVYTFDSDVQGWTADGGNGTVVWDGTHGRGGNGCLKYTVAAGNSECDPRVFVNFDTTTAFSLECDILVDPASGVDGNGSYGNLQLVARDSGGSWDSMWYGDMGGASGKFSTWHHVKMAFTSNYGPKASVQFQISGASAYSSDFIVYIDNVVIQDGTPGNVVTYQDFAWPEEAVPQSAWGPSAVWGWDNTVYAGGALKAHFDYGSGNTGWQDGAAQMFDYPSSWDASKFTYIAYDVYLDAPTGLPTYGQLQLHYLYSWTGISTVPLSADNIGKWTRYTNALTTEPSGQQGIVIHPGGNNLSGVFNYYFKNISLFKPNAPPRISAMRFEPTPTGAGAEILMNAKDNAYQRDAICVPATSPDYSWVGRTPMSYSFTIANFPDPVKHVAFEAHLFLVNESTIPAAGQWNETYGGCDWNAADLLKMTVENSAGGGVLVHLDWKTNTPGANPPAGTRVVDGTAPTAVGTWTLNFDSDTTGTITGPGGFTTNFTLPQGVATQFDPNGAAPLSFLQFGMGQNDGQANNHNYNVSGVFSAISMSGGLYAFNETFPGPALNSSGTAWRTTGDAVQWVPANTAAWVTWTTPDDGFSLQVAPNLSAWSDGGVTTTYSVGATRLGAVPAASMPTGNAAFFRLKKP